MEYIAVHSTRYAWRRIDVVGSIRLRAIEKYSFCSGMTFIYDEDVKVGSNLITNRASES